MFARTGLQDMRVHRHARSNDFEENMQIPYWLAAAALAALPLAAAQPPQAAGPADIHAQVAPPSYTSAFSGYRSLAAPQEAPDRLWRQANREMQELGGHAGHMNQPAPELAPATPAGDAPPGHAHHPAGGQ
ncbi:MAG TPA: hypothetical protein VL051_14210 [Burkholderiaceae bacterium]|nr:hypothetical protein [Burkholderiaceae bacterium]